VSEGSVRKRRDSARVNWKGKSKMESDEGRMWEIRNKKWRYGWRNDEEVFNADRREAIVL
jgi:hypothetical protein